MTLIITIRNESRPGKDGTRSFSIAACEGLSAAKSKGGVIHELARLLQEAGHNRETPVIVQRDGVTVFGERPLREWADYMLYEPDGGPMRLIKWNYEAQAKLKAERTAKAEKSAVKEAAA